MKETSEKVLTFGTLQAGPASWGLMPTYSQWHSHPLICLKTSEGSEYFKFRFSFFDLSELMNCSLISDCALRLRFTTTTAATVFQPQLKILPLIKSLNNFKFLDPTASVGRSGWSLILTSTNLNLSFAKCACGEPRFYLTFHPRNSSRGETSFKNDFLCYKFNKVL